MTSLKIVDAVQELMAKNGSLGEIKASLRSNVISILTNEMEPKANSVAAYAEDETGKLSLSLVRDLLSTLDMKNTLRVFEAESGATHTQLSRENFMKALSLESSPEIEGVPLIDSLISSAKSRMAASSPMAPSAATKAPTTGSSTKKEAAPHKPYHKDQSRIVGIAVLGLIRIVTRGAEGSQGSFCASSNFFGDLSKSSRFSAR